VIGEATQIRISGQEGRSHATEEKSSHVFRQHLRQIEAQPVTTKSSEQRRTMTLKVKSRAAPWLHEQERDGRIERSSGGSERTQTRYSDSLGAALQSKPAMANTKFSGGYQMTERERRKSSARRRRKRARPNQEMGVTLACGWRQNPSEGRPTTSGKLRSRQQR
jgi:hypothetical protein